MVCSQWLISSKYRFSILSRVQGRNFYFVFKISHEQIKANCLGIICCAEENEFSNGTKNLGRILLFTFLLVSSGAVSWLRPKLFHGSHTHFVHQVFQQNWKTIIIVIWKWKETFEPLSPLNAKFQQFNNFVSFRPWIKWIFFSPIKS